MSQRILSENKEETIPSDDDIFNEDWPLESEITNAVMDFAEVFSQFTDSFSSDCNAKENTASRLTQKRIESENKKDKTSSDDEIFKEEWPFESDVTDAVMDCAEIYSQLTDDFDSDRIIQENNTDSPPRQIIEESPVSEKF